jgi:hypothetical protein
VYLNKCNESHQASADGPGGGHCPRPAPRRASVALSPSGELDRKSAVVDRGKHRAGDLSDGAIDQIGAAVSRRFAAGQRGHAAIAAAAARGGGDPLMERLGAGPAG